MSWSIDWSKILGSAAKTVSAAKKYTSAREEESSAPSKTSSFSKGASTTASKYAAPSNSSWSYEGSAKAQSAPASQTSRYAAPASRASYSPSTSSNSTTSALLSQGGRFTQSPGLPNTGDDDEAFKPAPTTYPMTGVPNSGASFSEKLFGYGEAPGRDPLAYNPLGHQIMGHNASSETGDDAAPTRVEQQADDIRQGQKEYEERIPDPAARVSHERMGLTSADLEQDFNDEQIFQEMTWEQYDALNSTDRAAVDANTILSEAIMKDTALIEELDLNGDGRVSYDEGADNFATLGDGSGSYEKNVDRIFDRNGEREDKYVFDDSELYAPSTVAALNLLDISDEVGSLEDYFNGSAFITADDMAANLHDAAAFDDAEVHPSATDNVRREWLTSITANTENLELAFENKQAIVDGLYTSIDMNDGGAEKMRSLVSSITNDMASGADFDTIFAEVDGIRPDLSGLMMDEDAGYTRDIMTQLYANMVNSGEVTQEKMHDEDWMAQHLEESGITNGFDEWVRTLEALNSDGNQNRSMLRSAASAGDPNAYTSTAGTEE